MNDLTNVMIVRAAEPRDLAELIEFREAVFGARTQHQTNLRKDARGSMILVGFVNGRMTATQVITPVRNEMELKKALFKMNPNVVVPFDPPAWPGAVLGRGVGPKGGYWSLAPAVLEMCSIFRVHPRPLPWAPPLPWTASIQWGVLHQADKNQLSAKWEQRGAQVFPSPLAHDEHPMGGEAKVTFVHDLDFTRRAVQRDRQQLRAIPFRWQRQTALKELEAWIEGGRQDFICNG